MPPKAVGSLAACRRARAIIESKLAVLRDSATDVVFSENPAGAKYTDLFSGNKRIFGKYFAVSQVKSVIGLPQKIRGVVAALGLRGRGKTVHLPVSTATVGALTHARHLVKISLADTIPPTLLPKDHGFRVVGTWLPPQSGK